jgi:predicted ATPase
VGAGFLDYEAAVTMTERRPLERISLAGYKSIRKLDNFPLDRGLNALIGANGAGKSNFIKFFELLGHLMTGRLQSYVAQHGGADAILFRGMKVTPEMTAHMVFGFNEYRFSLRAANDRSLFFSQESASYEGPRFGRAEHEQGSGHRESALASKVRSGGAKPVEQWVVDTLGDWRVYHFHDTSASAPVMGRVNIVDNEALRGDAGNLAAFLLRLKREHPDHYFRIEETVRQVAPFFAEFDLRELEQGQTQLLWKDRHSDLVYYPFQLSDGTIRYICLATLLLQPDPPSTVVIDEPELGLHPFAIELLSSLLLEAATRSQIIISTQSSLLLDRFEPQHIIVANHRDGETVLERLDSQRLSGWLEEYTLGQLWEKDELGGTP